MKKKKLIIIIIALLALIVTGVAAFLILNNAHKRIVIDECYGEVLVERRNHTLDAMEDMNLLSNDVVKIKDDSSLILLIDSDKHVLAKEGTVFEIVSKGSEKSGRININLKEGDALVTIDNKLFEKSSFEVNTPNATLSVRGTTFEASYDKDSDTSRVYVEEGVVNVKTDGDEMDVGAGQSVIVKDNKISEDKEYLLINVTRFYDVFSDDVADSDFFGFGPSVVYQDGNKSELWTFCHSDREDVLVGDSMYIDPDGKAYVIDDKEKVENNYRIFEGLYYAYILSEDEKSDKYFFDMTDAVEKAGKEGNRGLPWKYQDFPDEIGLKNIDGKEFKFKVIGVDITLGYYSIDKSDEYANNNVKVKKVSEHDSMNMYPESITYTIKISPEYKDEFFELFKLNDLKLIEQ